MYLGTPGEDNDVYASEIPDDTGAVTHVGAGAALYDTTEDLIAAYPGATIYYGNGEVYVP